MCFKREWNGGKRQSNMEALRILSMLMIITMHFFGHGGVMRSFSGVSSIQLLSEVLTGLSRVAVNLFILISGYFLSTSKFSWRKVLRLAKQIWFYSLLIFSVLVVFGKVQLNLRSIVYAFFPIATNSDEFSTEYIMMYILSPFMNTLIAQIDKRKYVRLLVALVCFFVVLPDVFCFMGETIPFGGSYGIVWFVVLYFTGAYLRKYPIEISKRKSGLLYLAAGLLVPASSIGASILYKITNLKVFWEFKELFYSYCSVLVFAASVAMFNLWLKIEIRNPRIKKIVSFFAPTTFGVYLIHDNRFVRGLLWQTLKPSSFANSWFLFAYWAIVICSIFVICALIDKARNVFFQGVSRICQ